MGYHLFPRVGRGGGILSRIPSRTLEGWVRGGAPRRLHGTAGEGWGTGAEYVEA